MSALHLLKARLDLVTHARPSLDYCKANRIDWTATQPHCGGVYIVPARFNPPWFDIDKNGEEAAVVEAMAEDTVTIVDLVAWPVTNPSRCATAIGAAAVLGENLAANPVTYFTDAPLRLFRTPLAWLQSGCDGSVILDPARGARWLLDLPTSRLAAEDETHAAEIAVARRRLVDGQRIVVPDRMRVVEAA